MSYKRKYKEFLEKLDMTRNDKLREVICKEIKELKNQEDD